MFIVALAPACRWTNGTRPPRGVGNHRDFPTRRSKQLKTDKSLGSSHKMSSKIVNTTCWFQIIGYPERFPANYCDYPLPVLAPRPALFECYSSHFIWPVRLESILSYTLHSHCRLHFFVQKITYNHNNISIIIIWLMLTFIIYFCYIKTARFKSVCCVLLLCLWLNKIKCLRKYLIYFACIF